MDYYVCVTHKIIILLPIKLLILYSSKAEWREVQTTVIIGLCVPIIPCPLLTYTYGPCNNFPSLQLF